MLKRIEETGDDKTMKIAALIDEAVQGGIMGAGNRTYVYQRIKEETEADALIVVTCGNFVQDGNPAETDKYQKAELLRKQGADLVLELPVYCTLTTTDTFAFAAVSMLEKLNCVNEFVAVTEEADAGILSAIVQFLFIESKEYQNTVKKYRAEGMDFNRAQAAAAERYVPGAEKILRSEANRRAVEYAKAMKRMYSRMKLHFHNIEKTDNGNTVTDAACDGTSCMTDTARNRENHFNQTIGARLKDFLDTLPDARKYFNEIAGGYAPSTESLLNAYRKNRLRNFTEFAEVLAAEDWMMDDAKRYLLRVLLGIRQVDISICGLYSYALYARALGEYNDSGLLPILKEKSWIPVFSEKSADDPEGKMASAAMDDPGKILTEIDRRANVIYHQVKI